MEEGRPPDVFLPTETVIVGDETGFHQLTVVFLHGLDRTSNHWGSTWEKLLAKAGPAGAKIKVICPGAPVLKVTLLNGLATPSWYDMPPLGPDMYTKLDRKRFSVSLAYAINIVEKEVHDGTPLNRIVVAGHGQGGCIAVHMGLRLNEQLAGVMVFSALLLPERVHKHEKSQEGRVFKDVPWYWGHGMSDPIFPFDLGKWSYLQLKQLGINIQWGWYAGHQHVYFEEMLVDSMRFLAEVKGRTKFLPAALNWLNVKETETEEELDVEAAVMTLHAYLAPLEKPRHSVRTAEELNKCTDDQLRGVIRDWLDRQYNTDERSKPKLLEVGAVCLPLPMVKTKSELGDSDEEPPEPQLEERGSSVEQMTSAFDSALELLASHAMVRRQQDERSRAKLS